MKLKKTSERAVRNFDENNIPTETVESAEYVVMDDDGNTIGSATCRNYGATLNLNVSADSIAGGARKLADMLGATVEEGGEA